VLGTLGFQLSTPKPSLTLPRSFSRMDEDSFSAVKVWRTRGGSGTRLGRWCRCTPDSAPKSVVISLAGFAVPVGHGVVAGPLRPLSGNWTLSLDERRSSLQSVG
jgi:hypothetical protein